MGRRVAAQLVGDEPTGETPLLLQQRSKELDRRASIPSRLDEDVQHVAILIHGSPQVLCPAIDRREELVEMPRVAQPAVPLSEPACVGVTLTMEVLSGAKRGGGIPPTDDPRPE